MAKGDVRPASSSQSSNLFEDSEPSTFLEAEAAKQGSLDKRGTIHNDNGDVYEGELRDGKKHGKGILRYANGDVYDGEWKDGAEHGEGTLTWKNGDGYEGQWVEGDRHGRGEMTWADGSAFEGDVYEGEFKDNKRHGKGVYTWKDGAVYDGEWKEGKQHGVGTNTWSNGNAYEGQWVEGKEHGRGTMKYASGDVYEGQWAGGKRHGEGTLKYSSGGVNKGIWTAGHMTQGEMTWGKYALCGEEKRKVYDEREFRSQRSQCRRLQAAKKTCEHCGANDYHYKLRVCSGCGLALYCSAACQKAASGSHRRICDIRSELPPQDASQLVLKYDKDKMIDLDAGLRYGTKYMHNLMHLEINVTSKKRNDTVKLSAKQLSSLLRSKKGALISVFWWSNDYIQAGGGDGRIEHGFIWKELHDLKQLRLQHMRFDDVQSICDIIGQQKNTLLVLSLPYLGIEWHKAKCRRTLAQTVNSCKHLVKLTLSDCMLTDSDLKIMLNDVPNLRTLNLSTRSGEFTDKTCGLIARKCPGLQELDLDYHEHISVRGICKIFGGCLHLRSFYTTARKLSCKDVHSLLDIAPQLLFLSLNEKLALAEEELDEIIEATGGRTVLRLSNNGAVVEPDGVSAKTKERYESQTDVLRNVGKRRRDPEVANEWAGMLEG